VFLVTDDT